MHAIVLASTLIKAKSEDRRVDPREVEVFYSESRYGLRDVARVAAALGRYKRMSGFNVCWMPGIDHAGIATQMVVDRELQKREGKSRQDLGRDEFLRRVWQWKEQSGNRIALQHRALGASLDWERERFTMDEHSSRAVREAFVRLYQDGLLYRAERLINWCVKDGTALSDLEVDHEEHVKSELYKFA